MVRQNYDDYMSKDVLIEIFLRRPVKSLIRLNCICKYWSTMMKNSSFIYSHFHHHSNIANLFVQHYDHSTENYTFALFPNETIANSSLEYHNLGDHQMPTQPGILGIFHGIIGLWDRDRIVLWNPAIREFRILLVPSPDLPPYSTSFVHFSGFGLDPITNNYKVIWIREYWENRNDDTYLPKVVSLYNLYTDSWRHFGVDLPNNMHDSSCNTCMNGFYYWMTDYNCIISIITFDMDKEIFGDIPGPTIPEYDYGDIVLLNNYIALLYWDLGYEVEKCFHIWVMKEEGFWIEELTIGPLLEVYRPLGFWENGEVFFETNNSELVLYNCHTQEMKVFQNRGRGDALKTFIYKESLVSVKRGNECQKGDNVFNVARIQDFFLFD